MKDRIAEYPGRVVATRVPGTTDTYDVHLEDSPTELGTPLNKQTFLTDLTAAALGLSGDPTVNDALSALNSKAELAQLLSNMEQSVSTNATKYPSSAAVSAAVASAINVDILADLVNVNSTQISVDLTATNLDDYKFFIGVVEGTKSGSGSSYISWAPAWQTALSSNAQHSAWLTGDRSGNITTLMYLCYNATTGQNRAVFLMSRNAYYNESTRRYYYNYHYGAVCDPSSVCVTSGYFAGNHTAQSRETAWNFSGSSASGFSFPRLLIAGIKG